MRIHNHICALAFPLFYSGLKWKTIFQEAVVL